MVSLILKYGEQMIFHPSFKIVKGNLAPRFFVCLQNVWFIFLQPFSSARNAGQQKRMGSRLNQLIRLLFAVTVIYCHHSHFYGADKGR